LAVNAEFMRNANIAVGVRYSGQQQAANPVVSDVPVTQFSLQLEAVL
jgi:hypothetical protein